MDCLDYLMAESLTAPGFFKAAGPVVYPSGRTTSTTTVIRHSSPSRSKPFSCCAIRRASYTPEKPMEILRKAIFFAGASASPKSARNLSRSSLFGLKPLGKVKPSLWSFDVQVETGARPINFLKKKSPAEWCGWVHRILQKFNQSIADKKAAGEGIPVV